MRNCKHKWKITKINEKGQEYVKKEKNEKWQIQIRNYISEREIPKNRWETTKINEKWQEVTKVNEKLQ